MNSLNAPTPALSHNLAVTPGIPLAGNQCSPVQHTRRSRGHKSFIRGEAALMSLAWQQSRPLMCAYIPCVAPTSLLDRVLLPLRPRKKCTPRKSCVMPVGAMFYTPGIEPALSGTRPPCTSRRLRYQCGSHPPTPHRPHRYCHRICRGRTRAAALHDRRRCGLHEPR